MIETKSLMFNVSIQTFYSFALSLWVADLSAGLTLYGEIRKSAQRRRQNHTFSLVYVRGVGVAYSCAMWYADLINVKAMWCGYDWSAFVSDSIWKHADAGHFERQIRWKCLIGWFELDRNILAFHMLLTKSVGNVVLIIDFANTVKVDNLWQRWQTMESFGT